MAKGGGSGWDPTPVTLVPPSPPFPLSLSQVRGAAGKLAVGIPAAGRPPLPAPDDPQAEPIPHAHPGSAAAPVPGTRPVPPPCSQQGGGLRLSGGRRKGVLCKHLPDPCGFPRLHLFLSLWGAQSPLWLPPAEAPQKAMVLGRVTVAAVISGCGRRDFQPSRATCKVRPVRGAGPGVLSPEASGKIAHVCHAWPHEPPSASAELCCVAGCPGPSVHLQTEEMKPPPQWSRRPRGLRARGEGVTVGVTVVASQPGGPTSRSSHPPSCIRVDLCDQWNKTSHIQL